MPGWVGSLTWLLSGSVSDRTASMAKLGANGLRVGGERKTEDEMVGWHHLHNGHGFGWTPGVGNGR